jgi:hypothetical protein
MLNQTYKDGLGFGVWGLGLVSTIVYYREGTQIKQMIMISCDYKTVMIHLPRQSN